MRSAALSLGRRVLAASSGAAASSSSRAVGAAGAAPSAALLAQTSFIADTANGLSGASGSRAASTDAARPPPRSPPFFSSTSRAAAAVLGVAASAAVAAAGFSAAAHLTDPESMLVAQAKAAVPKSSLPFKDVTLYQYDVCPFCNKVKAMLDFHGIPYDVVEVNPLFKSEIKFSEYKKVPVVVIDGEQFNDSSVIMRTVDERMAGKAGRGGGLSKAAREKEAKWAAWVDERFVHVVTPNIYRTWGEAWRAFDYITERGNFDVFQRYAVRLSGTVSMYLISQNVLKKRHNIVDERKELYLCMEDWMANAVGKQAFCGGDQPNLADIAVFGVLRAVKTFETFTDACANTSVGPWYKRMEAEVGESTRTDGVQN